MPLFSRYVLSEVLQVFLLVVTVLSVMLLLVGVGREAVEHGLGFGPIARLMPYVLPQALLFAVPAALLFAVTSVFGRMSAAGEVVALGAGHQPDRHPAADRRAGRGAQPGDLLAQRRRVFLEPAGREAGGDRRRRGNHLQRAPHAALLQLAAVLGQRQAGRRQSADHALVHVSLRRPAPVLVRAREAELKSNPGSGVLTVICRDGSIEMDGNTFEFSDTFEREIRLMDAGDTSGESPSRLSLKVLAERTPKQVKLIERLEQQQAAGAALALTGGDFARLAGPTAAGRRQMLAEARTTLYRMRTEPLRRWANGFSCFSSPWSACRWPFAAAIRKSGRRSSSASFPS